MKQKHLKTPIYVLCYKHDWDLDKQIYPEVHTYCYLTYQEAKKDKASMSEPSKYWIRKTYLQTKTKTETEISK